jgi:predicted small metal-binding protein
MFKTIPAVLALALFCSSPAFAQEAAAKKAGMDDHHAALKSVTCDPACGFAVKSHDDAELVEIVRMHAKRHHNKEMSEADVRKMMKEEQKMDQKMDQKMEKKEKE